MGEREMADMLPGDTTAGLSAKEEIRRKSYSEVVIEGVRIDEGDCGGLDS